MHVNISVSLSQIQSQWRWFIERYQTADRREEPDDSGAAPDEDGFARDLFDLTNEFRVENGRRPLEWDDKLALAAQGHADDMADKNYFSHTQPDGDTLRDRLLDEGYRFSRAGENIARGQDSPEEVMQAWENSAGHRANLLNPNFREFGGGYADDGSQDVWVQNFGTELV